MNTNNSWDAPASAETLSRTKAALEENGFAVIEAADGADAKQKALDLVPKGAEVMTMTSVTLDSIGLSEALNDSGKYDSVRDKLAATEDPSMKQKLGAAPDWAVGSVHAVTEDGRVLVASRTGSQLPAYAYGAQHVIWIVGTQKIARDVEEGMKRIYDYVLPLESERAKKAYGVSGSAVSKLLTMNEENPGRITIIFVPEALGF